MYQSHDLHHAPQNKHHQTLPIPNNHTCNIQNYIKHHNSNHSIYAKLGIREEMGNIEGAKINIKGENDDLEMDKVQDKV